MSHSDVSVDAWLAAGSRRPPLTTKNGRFSHASDASGASIRLSRTSGFDRHVSDSLVRQPSIRSRRSRQPRSRRAVAHLKSRCCSKKTRPFVLSQSLAHVAHVGSTVPAALLGSPIACPRSHVRRATSAVARELAQRTQRENRCMVLGGRREPHSVQHCGRLCL